jgi:hypothetical protein
MGGGVTVGEAEDPGAGDAFCERFGGGGSLALLHPAVNMTGTAHSAK